MLITNNNTATKGFKAVDFMREVRDKISLNIKDMNFEEIQKHVEARRLKLSTKKLTNIPVSKQFENKKQTPPQSECDLKLRPD